MIENLAIIPDSRGRAVLEKQLTDTHRITPHLIGKSIIGREIRAFTVGKGARGVLYVGTHHSLEAITANILYGFLDRLLTEQSELAEHFTLTVKMVSNKHNTLRLDLLDHSIQSMLFGLFIFFLMNMCYLSIRMLSILHNILRIGLLHHIMHKLLLGLLLHEKRALGRFTIVTLLMVF